MGGIGLSFKRFRSKNGMTLGDVDTSLANLGVVLVRGINLDVMDSRVSAVENLVAEGRIQQIFRDFPGFPSNGTGKSSFPEIIRDLFYGTTGRGLKKDGLIRGGSEGGMCNELEVDRAGTSYLIRKTRKDDEHGDSCQGYVLEEGKLPDQFTPKKGQDASQAIIRDRVAGMTEEQYLGSVYLTGENDHPLINGTGPERSKYLSSTFGLDRIDLVKTKAAAKLAELVKKLVEADRHAKIFNDSNDALVQLGDYEFILLRHAFELLVREQAQRQLRGLRCLSDSMLQRIGAAAGATQIQASLPSQTPRDKLLGQRKNEIQYLEEMTATNAEHRVELEGHQIALEAKREQEAKRKAAQDFQKTHQDSLVPVLTTADHIDPAGAAPENEVAALALEEFLKEVSHWERLARRAKASNLSVVDPPPSNLETKRKKHQDGLQFLTDELTSISQKAAILDSLSNLGATCPKCRQVVDQIHLKKELEEAQEAQSFVTLLKSKISKSTVAINGYDYMEASWKTFQTFCADARENMPISFGGDPVTDEQVFLTVTSSKLLARANQSVRDARELNRLWDEYSKSLNQGGDHTLMSEEQMQSRMMSIAINEPRIAKSKENVAKLDAHVALLTQLDKIPTLDLGHFQNLHTSVQEDIRQLEADIREHQKHLDLLIVQVTTIQDLKHRRNKAEEEFKKHEADYREAARIKAFIKGLEILKIKRLREIVEAMQVRLPEYIPFMFKEPGMAFELDDENPESIAFWCRRTFTKADGSPGSYAIPVNAFSKGERARLKAVLVVTRSEMIHPSKKSNLIIMDEVDDGMDGQGLTGYVQLLEHIRHKYESVLVVTHRQELSGLTPDWYWTVIRKNKVSRLVVEKA